MSYQMKASERLRQQTVLGRIPLVLLILLIAAGAAISQEDKGMHEEAARVMALEVLWSQAEVNHDTKALGQMLTDTMVYVDVDGSVRNKQEFLDFIASGGETMESLKNETMVAHVYGNTVVVSGIYLEKGKNKGKPYTRRGRFTDTWVKVNGAWLCAASHSTLVEK
jgi:ketosteroid isomerase-like protein